MESTATWRKLGETSFTHSASSVSCIFTGHCSKFWTVVVHNIKTFAEYVAIAAYFERYRQSISSAAVATRAADARSPWTQPMLSDSRKGKADFYRELGVPQPAGGA